MGKCLEQALAFCVPLQCLASKMEQYYYISLVALAQAGIWVASHGGLAVSALLGICPIITNYRTFWNPSIKKNNCRHVEQMFQGYLVQRAPRLWVNTMNRL